MIPVLLSAICADSWVLREKGFLNLGIGKNPFFNLGTEIYRVSCMKSWISSSGFS